MTTYGEDDRGKISRRDLIRGKLWKLIPPAEPPSVEPPSAELQPLVMRYPKRASDVDPDHEPSPSATPRTIGGISIEAVAPTKHSSQCASRSTPVFRPPGAVEERQFLAGCTRCSDCRDACPHDAIRKAPERLAAIVGTPVIEADTAACLMCEDFPCITACQPGVLKHALPKVMGVAKVTQHLCLAHHGTTCTVCSERCPVEAAVTVMDGKPTINEEACTGCGVCRYVCPAPENAILLMPTFTRPTSPVT